MPKQLKRQLTLATELQQKHKHQYHEKRVEHGALKYVGEPETASGRRGGGAVLGAAHPARTLSGGGLESVVQPRVHDAAVPNLTVCVGHVVHALVEHSVEVILMASEVILDPNTGDI